MPLLTRRSLLLAFSFFLSTAACGLSGAGDPPPPVAFPQDGPGPFQLLSGDDLPGGDAPNLYLPAGYSVDEPTALAPRGAQLQLLLTATATQTRAMSFIAQVVLDALTQAEALTPVLQADQPWEGQALHHPTLLVDATGTLPRYLLLYQGQDGSVGLASADEAPGGGPGAFRKAVVPLLPLAQDASLTSATGALIPGSLELAIYYLSGDRELRGVVCSGAELRTFLASGAAVPWQALGTLLSAADFQVGQRATDLQTAQRLLQVSARTVLTAAGRARYDLYLPATLTAPHSVVSLVAASSYDGAAFLAVPDPVLQTMSLGGQVTAATVAITPGLGPMAPPLGPSVLIAGWLGTQQGLVIGKR